MTIWFLAGALFLSVLVNVWFIATTDTTWRAELELLFGHGQTIPPSVTGTHPPSPSGQHSSAPQFGAGPASSSSAGTKM